MNKTVQKFTLLAAAFALLQLQAQAQIVSTFDTLPLADSSYWNGSNTPGGTAFNSGNVLFPNYYNTSFGGFWESGWAYSNITDSATAGSGNLYGTSAGQAYSGENFAVGQQNSTIWTPYGTTSQPPKGIYITNAAYPYLSMRDGDNFAKKFGGLTGNDPDYFKLTIRSYSGTTLKNDSVEFYLADFRFSDNSQDYIVNTWKYVDLTPLGTSDSLLFTLSSSDVGTFGINTPMFFNIDDFTSGGLSASSETARQAIISIYPNPANDVLFVRTANAETGNYMVSITDITGKRILEKQLSSTEEKLTINTLPAGTYMVRFQNNGHVATHKLIKQ